MAHNGGLGGRPRRGWALAGVELDPPSRIAVHKYFQKYPIFSIIVKLITTKIKDYEKEIG